MNINDYDKDFNKELFISKINNIYILLFTSYMMKDLERVKHVISDSIYQKYQNNIDNLKNNRQMYEQLNVKNSSIDNFEVKDNKIYITTTIIGRYYDYLIDENGKNITTPNNNRTEKKYTCVFMKKIDTKKQGIVRYCPNCGMHMDVNYSGKCSYCRSFYDTENYDYILESIED